jgi:hypothetical protein
LSGGLTLPPDGSAGIRKAHLEESSALWEHTRVLRLFTDLILYGKRLAAGFGENIQISMIQRDGCFGILGS